jgi:hypothetical protein
VWICRTHGIEPAAWLAPVDLTSRGPQPEITCERASWEAIEENGLTVARSVYRALRLASLLGGL